MAGFVIVVGHASGTASAAVKLAGDGVGNVAELLLLLIEVLGGSIGGVVVEPVLDLLDGVKNLFSYQYDSLSAKNILVDLQCPCRPRQSCHRDHPRR